MNDSNDKMARWEKLGLFCYYKLFMQLRKWYSVIWKWTWVHCKCLLQTLGQPRKGKTMDNSDAKKGEKMESYKNIS